MRGGAEDDSGRTPVKDLGMDLTEQGECYSGSYRVNR